MTLLAALFILAGVTLLAESIAMWQHSRNWPSVAGKVLKLEPLNDLRFPTIDTVYYQLKYEFRVDGQSYSGDRISVEHHDRSVPRSDWQDCLEKYGPGTRVTVTYSPEFPGDESFLEPVTWQSMALIPGGTLLFGLWITYLLRKTRVRRVPRRVIEDQDDPDSPRWHVIYQSVLEKNQIEIRGTAWYARSEGLSQWPKSRVGLVATPNTIAVVRGPFTPAGTAAAFFTGCFEFFLNIWLAIFHGFGFVTEWLNRIRTWRHFKNGDDPHDYATTQSTADIVSIDQTVIHGYDARKHELWFRLPSRPVDDCIKLSPQMMEEIEQFIGFVRLMQHSNRVATDDQAIIDEIEFLD